MVHIHAHDLCLRFPIVLEKKSLRQTLARGLGGGILHGMQTVPQQQTVMISALDGLNFAIHDGERVGLIGHNGAGKSTLLKTLARVYGPSSGVLDISGRVETLIDVSFGVDPEVSGFGNIRFVLELLGVSGKKLDRMCQEIADFTELGDKLMLPVRTYSSGMQTRLSFAISTALDPEILLIDEVIGTGDATFYKKAQARVEKLRDTTRILILASHSDELIKQWCDRVLWLEQGKIRMDGPTDEVLATYGEFMTSV